MIRLFAFARREVPPGAALAAAALLGVQAWETGLRPPVAEAEPAPRKRPTPAEWLAAWNWRHLPQVTYLRRLRASG